MDGYSLHRRWFDFAFENSDCKCVHTALYTWIVELNNRLGWKSEFGIPTADTMEGLSIGDKRTYLSALRDLNKWGFIRIVREAKNQYQACIISVIDIKSEQYQKSTLDSAVVKSHHHHPQHTPQHNNGTTHSTPSGTLPIDKQLNSEQINKETTIDDASVVNVESFESKVVSKETLPEIPKKPARSRKKDPEEFSIVHKIKVSILEISPGYRWNGMDGKHAKELADAICGICTATIQRKPTDDETLKYIRKMIDNIPEYWDSWTIPKLNGSFNEISAKIQKPRSRGKIMDSAIAIHQASQRLLDKGLITTYDQYLQNLHNNDDEPF